MYYIDDMLNRVTMYRLVLYYLIALILAAFGLSFFHVLPVEPDQLAFSSGLILLVCAATNWIFARIFDAATNVESVYITALIVALIVSPVAPTDAHGVGALIFISVAAMASKYILAIGKKHVFNPAALAIALSAIVLDRPASWWVAGTASMLPLLLLGGILMVRKMRRFDLVLSFAFVALIATVATSHSTSYVTPVIQTFLHSSFFFLAFVMLTEPLTTPPNARLRIIYGSIVGFLFAPNIHIGTIYFTPELALLIGNIFAYIVSPKGRYMLTLQRIEERALGVREFIFSPDRRFAFEPGQYLEWTLSHKRPDARGNRRYFTIASSPEDESVRIGVKFYDRPSSFKHALASMSVGSTISASHLAGSFVMPRQKDAKLVFIAGGIGVTPFLSMIQHLLDKKEARPITMLYSNKTLADVAYKDVFDSAQSQLGIKTVYSLSAETAPADGMVLGPIDRDLILREVPDYKERTFYISGPHAMVDAFKQTLVDMGISRLKIKCDFFPGFV